MENHFKFISLEEENKLTLEEKKEYYQSLREYAVSRKLTNTTPGATTKAPKLKKITNNVASVLIDVLEGGKVIKLSDGQQNIPDGPVIYAHTHQGILDNFAWIPATPEHAIILHSSVVKKSFVLILFKHTATSSTIFKIIQVLGISPAMMFSAIFPPPENSTIAFS